MGYVKGELIYMDTAKYAFCYLQTTMIYLAHCCIPRFWE